MQEEAIGFEGNDVNEMTDPITPQLRAIDGFNPMDISLREAYEHGVTTVATGPGSANVIGGQFAAIKTYGHRVDSMVVKEPLAMKCAFGENPKRVYNSKQKAPTTRMATAALLRETLFKADEYRASKVILSWMPCCRYCAARSRSRLTHTGRMIFLLLCASPKNLVSELRWITAQKVIS